MTRLVSCRRNAHLSVVAAMGLLLSLAACGGETKVASPDRPRATSTPLFAAQAKAPATASPVDTTPTVGVVTWTSAIASGTRGPVDKVVRYFTDVPSIIAVMPAANLPPEAEIEARWSYNSTSLDALATRHVVDRGPGDRWITIRLDRAPDVPWPAGVYQLAVSLNGVLVQESSIDVIDPE